MKKFFKIVGIIIGAFIVLGIIGAIVDSSSQSSSQPTTPPEKILQPTAPATPPAPPSSSSQDDELKAMLQAAPAPVVVKSDVDTEITYTLTNNTQDSFDYVELDVDFYNKAGVKIENGMTNTTNVTPGQKFELKVTTMNADYASYKVTGIYSSALH